MEFNEIYFHAAVAVKVEGNKQYNVLFEKRSAQSIVDGFPERTKMVKRKQQEYFRWAFQKV